MEALGFREASRLAIAILAGYGCEYQRQVKILTTGDTLRLRSGEA